MEIPPPPRDDAAPDLKDLLGEPDREEPGDPFSPGDPLAAAARASLPEGYGSAGGAPDPLAALGREPVGAPARSASEAPRFASVAKPRAERNVATLVLLALGLVVLLAVLAFAVFRGAQPPAPQPPAPGAAERANSR
jgi:hypothetical protein